MSKIDFILTSFARWDLLEKTLDSVDTYLYPYINRFIVHDDMGLDNYTQEDWDKLISIQRKYTWISWLTPNQRRGQIKALDSLMKHVTTPYYFSLEEDWEILKGGFIEQSMQILELHPECIQIQLRGLDNINGHPCFQEPESGLHILQKGYNGRWDGFGFNPSLRRKSDYERIGTYSQIANFIPTRPWESEIAIGKHYSNLGYFTACLPDTYIKHIGDNRGIRH